MADGDTVEEVDLVPLDLSLDLNWLVAEDDASQRDLTNCETTVLVRRSVEYEGLDSGMLRYFKGEWIPAQGEKSPKFQPVRPSVSSNSGPLRTQEVFWNSAAARLDVRQSGTMSLMGRLASIGLSFQMRLINNKTVEREKEAWKKAASEVAAQKLDEMSCIAVQVDYATTVVSGVGTILYFFQRLEWAHGPTREAARGKLSWKTGGIYANGLLTGPPDRIRIVEIYPVVTERAERRIVCSDRK